MRNLIILRHGKAHPDAPLGDFARNLTDRGRRDAATIGILIAELAGQPDAIISSDADRARQTAEIIAEAIGFTGSLRLDHAIYDADSSDLLAVLASVPAPLSTVLIVGHNPGFETLAALLTGVDPMDIRLPTAGLAHVALDLDDWRKIAPGTGRLLALHSPKAMIDKERSDLPKERRPRV